MSKKRKKAKKHFFVHPDPEKEVVLSKSKNNTKSPNERAAGKKKNISSDLDHVFRDLKNTTLTIIIFTVILAAFCLVELKYSLVSNIVKSLF